MNWWLQKDKITLYNVTVFQRNLLKENDKILEQTS